MIDQAEEFIANGKIDELRKLLKSNPSLLNTTTSRGISLILWAAYHRNKEIVDFLAGLKPTIKLFDACALGYTKEVEDHLDNHPDDINKYAPDGFTALGLACFFGQIHIVDLLIERGAKINLPADNDFKVAPIHSAAAISNVELVKLLIHSGANPNVQQSGGITPLHSAAHNGNYLIVKMLLDHGAHPGTLTHQGKSAVDFAREGGFNDIIELLKEEIRG